MASTDLKKRLNSLRNLTEDLKNSTQSPSINLSYIKSLIGNLKELSEPSGFPQKYSDSYEQDLSPSSLDYEASSEQYTRLFKPKNSIDGKHELLNEKEIIALREENLRLEEKLAAMREELLKIEQKGEQKEERNENELPFFRLNEILSVFVCRFQISENDYPKVEYVGEKIELQLDKMLVCHKEKGSVEEFDMATLYDVNYLPSNVVLYRFEEFIEEQPKRQIIRQDKPSKDLTYVFLKYSSPEQCKKWDLGIFINYQLISSLKDKELFKSHFLRIRGEEEAKAERELLQSIKMSEELDTDRQKFLLQLFRKRKESFVEVKNLIQDKLQIKKEHNISLSNQEISSPELGAQESNMKEVGLNISNNKESVFAGGPEGEKQEQKRDLPIGERGEVSKVVVDIADRSNRKEEEKPVLANSNSIEHENRGHTISFSRELKGQQNPSNAIHSNFASPKISNQHIYSTARPSKGRDLFESARSNRSDSFQHSSKRLSVVQFKIGQARKNLQEGYEAIKYSKDGFSPHQKKVFLSMDLKKLCWSEKDRESEYKSIPLEVIIKVEYGVIGQGIAKHVKQFDPLSYCVIDYYTGDYKKKTIELKGETRQKTRAFAEELQIILDYSKGVSMNALIDS